MTFWTNFDIIIIVYIERAANAVKVKAMITKKEYFDNAPELISIINFSDKVKKIKIQKIIFDLSLNIS